MACSAEMYLTEYMKAVLMDRRRRINIHSTHCFGSGMTEESKSGIMKRIRRSYEGFSIKK